MKLKVTLEIFSGRENPEFIISGNRAKKLLDRIEPGSRLKGDKNVPAPPTMLGYRGIVIEQLDEKVRGIPQVIQIAGAYGFGDDSAYKLAAGEIEPFILDTFKEVKEIKGVRGFDKFLRKEIDRFYRVWELYPIKPPILKPVCPCAPPQDLSWWNQASIRPHNNCYNYATNYRTDTFAQPGKASSNQYTSLSGCSVAAGQKSAKDGAISDGLENNPKANNKCPKSGHLVALVIAPGYDFHWFRKGTNGKWSHKPGGTNATNLDNSGNTISDPRTADRGVYTQFCTFMTAIHGHFKIK